MHTLGHTQPTIKFLIHKNITFKIKFNENQSKTTNKSVE